MIIHLFASKIPQNLSFIINFKKTEKLTIQSKMGDLLQKLTCLLPKEVSRANLNRFESMYI